MPDRRRDWCSAEHRPRLAERRSALSGARADRLVELGAVTDRLARVGERAFIPIWLTRSIEALDDEKPVEVLARGEYRQIARLIAELESPVCPEGGWMDVETVAVVGEWIRHAPHRSFATGAGRRAHR